MEPPNVPDPRQIARELRESLSLFGFLVLALIVPAVAGLALTVA
ncbi:MAG: hypothetical protein WEA54_04300 [Actinomycetota bacterium]